jgi:hypothetical protein
MAPKSSLKSASKTSISNPGKRTSFSTDSPSKPSKPKSILKPAKEPEATSEKSEGSDAEEDDHLYGFSTDEDDSSDDDEAAGDEVDIGKLPTIAKDDATVKRKLDKAKRHPVSLSTNYQHIVSYSGVDTRPRCDIHGLPTTWVLRRSAERISLSIRGCNKIAYLTEQKGTQIVVVVGII